jgi:hypothetical protein
MMTAELELAESCFDLADALAAMCLAHMTPVGEPHLVLPDTSLPAHTQALKELLIGGYADRHDDGAFTIRREVIAEQREALLGKASVAISS